MTLPKIARADVRPRRQRTQYSCMACSMAMCLTANGIDADEDTVNEVMGAQPMRGAAWEQALACAQHYGMRATLTVPATLSQVKALTDRGVPVMIAWNPEGREWSHASVVVDVVPDETHGFMVHVADPNIPDPEQTVRVVTKDEFYKKWYEKWPSYLVRRPAMAVEREVTPDGRQVMASTRTASVKKAEEYDCHKDWKRNVLSWKEYQECLRRFRDSGAYKPEPIVPLDVRISYYLIYDALHRLNSNDESKVANPLDSEFASPGNSVVYIDGIKALENDLTRAYKNAGFPPPTLYSNKSLNPAQFDVDGFFRKHPLAERNPTKDDLDQVMAEYVAKLRSLLLEDLKRKEEYRTETEINSIEADMLMRDINQDLMRQYDDRFYRVEIHSSAPATKFLVVDDSGLFAFGGPDTYATYDWFNFLDSGKFRIGQLPPDVLAQVLAKPKNASIPLATFSGYMTNVTWRGNWPKTTNHPIEGWARVAAAYILREKKSIAGIPREQVREIYDEGKRRVEEEKRRVEEEKRRVEAPVLAKKFAILDRMISTGFPQARDIAREVKSVYEAGGKPDEDQLRALRNMMYRSRMKAEADMFRVASTYQTAMVASSYPIKVRNPGQLDAAARRVMQEFEDGDLSYKDMHEYLTRRGFDPQPLHDYAKLEADPAYQAWRSRNFSKAGADTSGNTHVAKVKETVKIKREDLPKQRHGPDWVQDVVRRPGGGSHHTREKDVEEGRSRKPKHKQDWADREANDALIFAWGKM